MSHSHYLPRYQQRLMVILISSGPKITCFRAQNVDCVKFLRVLRKLCVLIKGGVNEQIINTSIL